MPTLALKLSTATTADEARQLALTLTDLTVDLLHKRRELTAVSVETIAPGHWYIGGDGVGNLTAQTFQLTITVTEGTNSDDEKARFIAAVFGTMADFLGRLDPASYVVVQDVAGEAWGYGGRTQASRRTGTAAKAALSL